MSIREAPGGELAEPLLITAMELGQLLQVSTRTLWRLRSAGELPQPVRLGGAVRWRLDEVRKWIADGCPLPQARENERRRA
jgi:predicted DNA-binding transcriptional regulator AlpA